MPSNSRDCAGAVTVFHPMCGNTSASRRSTRPGHSPKPTLSSPNSSPTSNITCMPTQMPSTGRPPASRTSTIRGPSTRCSPAIHAANAPTPGTTSPSQFRVRSSSAVTVTCAPTAVNARAAECRLPDP